MNQEHNYPHLVADPIPSAKLSFWQRHALEVQISLFILTFITTVLAGIEWQFGKFLFTDQQPLTLRELWGGMQYALALLFILTTHEFGHYFMAKHYKVAVTLPYYLPIWSGIMSFLGGIPMPTLGTMGAFIRLKSVPHSRSEFFDIGIAGPLAGLIPAVLVLVWQYTHLPSADYILQFHPEYAGLNSSQIAMLSNSQLAIGIGDNLLMRLLSSTLPADLNLVPTAFETMHYPLLFAGYIALVFTSINLMPIGQLDGGHVLYGLIGPKRFNAIVPYFFTGFVFYAGLGIPTRIDPSLPDSLLYTFMQNGLYLGVLVITLSRLTNSWAVNGLVAQAVFMLQYAAMSVWPSVTGMNGWFVFALVTGRFLGIYHPATFDEKPLSISRVMLGIFALVVLVLTFTPQPIVLNIGE